VRRVMKTVISTSEKSAPVAGMRKAIAAAMHHSPM
jgi:hypothetical protein